MTWKDLSDGQGAVIAAGLGGLLTIVAAIVGVLLGKWIFGGKISNIESAIDTSNNLFEKHVSAVDEVLAKIKEKTDELDDVLAALSGQVGRIAESRASDDAFTIAQSEAEVVGEGRGSPMTGASRMLHKSDIRDLWLTVRDYIEGIASDPKIDGRKRAKYMRVDRRAYSDLICALRDDGYLSEAQSKAALAADAMWNSFKPRSIKDHPPTPTELSQMQEFAKLAAQE